MKQTLVILAALLGTGLAHAGTDYTCLNRCTASGSLYAFCNSKCSFSDGLEQPQARIKIKQTDYACLNQCTASGSLYQYCSQKCSYEQ